MNDFDVTRNILNKIRYVLNEASEGKDSIPITDEPKFGQKTLSNQKESFKKVIKGNVVFSDNPLIYYPKDKDLVFAGSISDLNNLKWQFRLNDPSGDGCYIWVEALQMSDDNLRKINLIKNYYTNWKNKLLEDPIF